MKKLLVALFFAAIIPLSGCASTIAETPAQRVYALQSEYASALAAAVSYESQPRCPEGVTSLEQACSQADIVAAIRDADTAAWTAILAAQNAVRDPAAQSTVGLALAGAREALNAFQQILGQYGLVPPPLQTSAVPPWERAPLQTLADVGV